MATFFYDVKVGFWSTQADLRGSLYGDVVRNGNTVTLTNMTFDMWPTASAWGTDNFTLQVNGTNTTWSVNAGALSGASVNSTSISVDPSSTSAQIGWSTSDGESGSFSISFPAGVTAPTGLSASNIVRGTNSFSATISVTGWGGTGDANSRYRELQAWVGDMTDDRRYQPSYGNSTSGTITVDNSSSGSATLTPNTKYTLGMYAANGTYNTGSQKIGNYTTLAEAPSLSVGTIGETTVEISYSTSADGGEYDKLIQYSLDNGTTWITGATITGGNASSGSFTISNLTQGTSYTIKTRVSTTAGTTNGSDIQFSTASSGPKLYGSVNNQTERITKFYGPIYHRELSDLDGEIEEGGSGYLTGFDANIFLSKFGSSLDNSKTVDYILFGYSINDYTYANLYYTDNTYIEINSGPSWNPSEYGFSTGELSGPVASDIIELTPTYSDSYLTKEIIKFYAPIEVQDYTLISGMIRSGGDQTITTFNGKTFLTNYKSTLNPTKIPDYILLTSQYPYLYYTDNTYIKLSNEESNYKVYGINVNNTLSVSTSTYIDLSIDELDTISGTIRSDGAGNVTSFDGTTFLNKVKSSLNSINLDYVRVIFPTGNENHACIYVYYTDNTPYQAINLYVSVAGLQEYGISASLSTYDSNDYIDLTTTTITPTTTYKTKLVYNIS